MPPPGVVPVDAPQAYQPQLAQVWAALAAEPNASPLVKSLAAQAQQSGEQVSSETRRMLNNAIISGG
jgi:hypothetical protein